MKIQYALMSCNANPRYIEYWPLVAAAWLKLGITPVCFFIPDTTHTLPEAPGGIVHTIPPLRDVHIAVQGLMLRYWGSVLYPGATVIISDMDAVPLAKDFFSTELRSYPEDAYVHVPPSGSIEYSFWAISNIPESVTHIAKLRHLFAWYHIARGEVMHRILNLVPDWETSCKKTVPYFIHQNAKISVRWHANQQEIMQPRPSFPWSGDEIYTSIRLHHSNHQPILYAPYSRPYPFMSKQTIRIRHVEANYSCAHLAPLRYMEHKETIDLFVTKRTLPPPQTPWDWFMDCLTYLTQKIKIVGPWLSLVLLSASMFVVRILYRRRHRELLKLLWLKRQLLLITKYPSMLRLQKQTISLKNVFAPK